MRPYQRSLLDQQDQFTPIRLDQRHQMVVLSRALDWDYMQVIAEEARSRRIKSTRGLKPHYRALNGAVVTRTLKSSDFRTTEDLIRNYIPARYLCDLQNSDWTPDHVAIWEYEGMLGERGLQAMTDYVLRRAAELGYADPRGLCSDTTAQEANIPHPTEVGHMNAFMKSTRSNLATLLKNSAGLPKKILGRMGKAMAEIAQKVRSHRLFAKTKEARMEINQSLEKLSESLLDGLGDVLAGIDETANDVSGMGKRALNNLASNYHAMCRMMPQISHWIRTGKVAKNKIVSLFNVDFRSINRGKIGKPIEFGLKWGVNQIRGGYVSVFLNSQMMAHDADYAVIGVVEHMRIFGKPPRDFGFDRAAWSEEHKATIRALGVKNVAIAPKGQADWEVGPRVKERMVRERAQVEGKIGTMKRHGLNKPESRLPYRTRMAALQAGLCLNLKRFAKDLTLSGAAQAAGAVA